jgi:hypothetical protein
VLEDSVRCVIWKALGLADDAVGSSVLFRK